MKVFAESSGATIYANMSWGNASTQRFNNSDSKTNINITYASFTSIPKAEKGTIGSPQERTNAIQNLGKWKVVSNGNAFFVNKLYITKKGNIKYEK